jgi:hypothetical protein
MATDGSHAALMMAARGKHLTYRPTDRPGEEGPPVT